MTETEQREFMSTALEKLYEAQVLLASVKSRNPGQPLAFDDLWYTANACEQEVRRTLNTLRIAMRTE
jgi:hypothetical protein